MPRRAWRSDEWTKRSSCCWWPPSTISSVASRGPRSRRSYTQIVFTHAQSLRRSDDSAQAADAPWFSSSAPQVLQAREAKASQLDVAELEEEGSTHRLSLQSKFHEIKPISVIRHTGSACTLSAVLIGAPIHCTSPRCPFHATPTWMARQSNETRTRDPDEHSQCRFVECPSSVATRSISSRRILTDLLVENQVGAVCIQEVVAGDFPTLPVDQPFVYDGPVGSGVKQLSTSVLVFAGPQSKVLQIQQVPSGACSRVPCQILARFCGQCQTCH